MIKKLYYYDLKKALRASFKNKYACYIDKKVKTKTWLSQGDLIYFEKPNQQ